MAERVAKQGFLKLSAEATGPGVLGVTSSTLHLTPFLAAQTVRDTRFLCPFSTPPGRVRLILPDLSAFASSLFAVFWCFFGPGPYPVTPFPPALPPPLKN